VILASVAENFQCRDSEWEIPIPKVKGKRDYKPIQKAWWDAISAIYESSDGAPVRLALEMRLTGGSDVTLALQRGNSLPGGTTDGTISIEVLTTSTTPEKEWQRFLQIIGDTSTSYTDENGKLLNARPHWAKEWAGLRVHKQPIEKYFKESAYKDAFAEFRDGFESIVTKRMVL